MKTNQSTDHSEDVLGKVSGISQQELYYEIGEAFKHGYLQGVISAKKVISDHSADTGKMVNRQAKSDSW